MTQRNRTILLLVCAALFFIIAPLIVLYSMGYGIDFLHKKIVATGGIYVRVSPQDSTVYIDHQINSKAGIFSDYVFEQSLMPGAHSVTIKKDGYFDYQKTLAVKENQVTKLESVIMFKQKPTFSLIENGIDYFSIAPNNTTMLISKNNSFVVMDLSSKSQQIIASPVKAGIVQSVTWSNSSAQALVTIKGGYFLLDFTSAPKFSAIPSLAGAGQISFNPQNSNELFFIKNKNLYSNLVPTPLVVDVLAYKKIDQNIFYLSYDGFLYTYDVNAKTTTKTSSLAFAVNENATYTLENISTTFLLKENSTAYFFNQTSGTFESFYGPISDLKISPDGQKFLYFNNHDLFFSVTSDTTKNALLSHFSENINNAYWINNDYILCSLTDKIIISEIDIRGNINIVTLDTGANSILANTKTFFNPQDKKLYLLSQGNLSASEKLVP